MARDHYVMKAHLAKFVLSKASKVLYPYRRGIGLLPWLRNGCGPKGLGWARDFYSQFLPDGTTTRRLDDALKYSEYQFFSSGKRNPSVLSRCIHDPEFFPTTSEQRRDITYCTTFTFCRAPVQIHNAAMLRHLGANIDAFNKIRADEPTIKSVVLSQQVPEDEAKKLVEKWKHEFLTGQLSIGVGEQHERQDGFNVINQEESLWVLIEMRWRLVEASPNDCFVTADNPVVIEDPSQPKKRCHGILQSPHVEVWYPISSRYGFLMDWQTHRPAGRTMLGHSKTQSLNRRIIKWCYKHVYSPRREAWIDRAVQQNDFSPLFDRLTSIEDLCDSASSNIVDVFWALENGEKADVFENMDMH